MPRKLAFDRVLFITIMLLCVLGLVMVYSASAVLAAEQYGSPYHFLIRQGVALVAGLGVMVVLMRANYRALGRGPVVYALFGLTALLLVGSLASPAVNGTHRWIKLGPLSLQPSELAKLSLILFLAWRLQRDPEDGDRSERTFVPCLVLSGFFIFLVLLQPDLGTAVSLSILAGAMLFIAGMRMRFLAGIGVAGVLVLLLLVGMKGYQMRRVTAFLNPEADPLGAGYQVRQSVISVGAGGEAGRGLGEGRQKLFFLPYPYTDFVYAVIGEELGLVGTVAVAGCFFVLLWRGLRAAARAPDLFGCYLAAGVTVFLVAQALDRKSVV